MYATGEQGFRWFIGIVEDINDPLMLGRLKIRVLSDQDNENELTTDELLWALPIMPITSAALNSTPSAEAPPGAIQHNQEVGAVGVSPTGAEVGSYAFGFYLDGMEKNMPMVFGTYNKMPDMSPTKSDVSPLARQQQTLKKTYEQGEKVTEPSSAYNSKYPYNKTYTTRRGHAIEIDDTPDAERIHVYHKSGTYIEINQDGRVVQKCVDDSYEVVVKNKKVYVKGNVTIEVDGNADIDVDGDVNIEVGGNHNEVVQGTYYVESKGNMKFKAPRIDLND